MGNMTIIANAEQFLLSIDSVAQRLRIVEFALQEAVSANYVCNVHIAVKEDDDLVGQDLLGKYATLEILDEQGNHSRYIHGIVGSFLLSAKDDKFTHYELLLYPEHTRLEYRRDYRVFQNKTVEDIVKEVLSDAGIPADMTEFDFSGNHKPREYCVQYGESDLAFIQRLLAEDGAFYYYEHEETLHKMVVSDHSTVHAPISDESDLVYHEQSGLTAEKEYVFKFENSEKIGTGSVSLTDYNYQKPTLNLFVEKSSTADENLPAYEYPGKYIDIDGGNTIAKQWVEGIEATRKTYKGVTNVRRVTSGFYFALTEHPRDEYNDNYLVIKTNIEGKQPGVLEEASAGGRTECKLRFESIPLDIVFRSPVHPVKPLIYGVQTAMVVGPSGEEIYTDKLGRVKIQFHWDRVGNHDENSSCWVRVSQTWSGNGWGSLYIPRIGQEVIVSFVNGDPDRPIITGQVYHGDDEIPFKLPDSKMVTGVKTRSTPQHDGANEISLNDTADKEKFTMVAQRDMSVTVKNDQTSSVGGKFSETIKKDASVTVSDGNYTFDVKTGTADFKVKGAVTETFDDAMKTTVKSNIDVSSTSGSITVKSDGGHVHIESVKDIQLKVGASEIKMDASGSITIKGVNIEINGVAIAVKGSANVQIKGATISSEADAINQVKGAVVLTDGSATNTVKGGMVMLNP